ncbi:acetyltransferase [Saccharothrix sp. NRRL B-16348]|uniref:GNAT family N-acetyltransferase n=1 Tax=Saccharothrix sp. NRRL B-16348 TaxID=1415542 RepID=UPI0006AE747A|nr:GNAT family N-acetyltransferase [Saccharothrix sp. NRRL B-16348]KOX27497.1 acetyltransferase [Saccharothrix sp. NRRL B-16348]
MTDEITVSLWRDQALAPLLLAYHLRTEAEKGAAVSAVEELPPRYRAEVLDPRAAFAADTVLVAETGGNAVGCVVASAPTGGSLEVKRLWVDPACRGRGAAKALVGSALRHAADSGAGSVRLSVWQWRQDALGLYERLGFTHEDSWDDRPGLVCMRRSVHE